jgi:DNA-binding MarR family transcriptional regulator
MRKEDLVGRVILGAREHNIEAVLFHQAAGQMLGVNVTDMKCLDIISLLGSASPSQLAALTGLTTGATTALIDRLERRQLVVRRRNRHDRRGAIVVLTARAARTLTSLFESLAAAMDGFVSGYTHAELALLADFFTKATLVWKKERERLQPIGPKRGRRAARRRTRATRAVGE